MPQRYFDSYGAIFKGHGTVAFFVIGLMLILTGCGEGTHNPTPPEARAWLYEKEFTHNPALMARPDQVVILALTPGVEAMAHAIPYEFADGGPYLFGIEADDPFITGAELCDQSGVPVLSVERGDGGAYMDLPPGTYSLTVFHDGTDVPSEGTVAFIRLQQTDGAEETGEPAAEKAEETGSLINPIYPAFVALRSNSAAPYHYLGTATIVLYFKNFIHPYSYLPGGLFSYLISNIPCRHHLFSFEPMTAVDCNAFGYPPFEGTYRLHAWEIEGQYFSPTVEMPCECMITPQCPSNQTLDLPPGTVCFPAICGYESGEKLVHVQSNNNGFFLLWSYVSGDFGCSPLYTDPHSKYIFWTEFQAVPVHPVGEWQIDTSFTFYRDGKFDRSTLEKGQVAVYEGENFTGAAAILPRPLDETSLICMPAIKSVAFGHQTDTTVQFFSDPDYKGLIKTVGIDTGQSLDMEQVKSIWIFDSKKVLISTNKCPHCNLAGVDLSKMVLDNADLSYANLMQAALNNSSLKTADMRYALFNGADLNYANLEGANLCGAEFHATAQSGHNAATLEYAYLKNVNLSNANLSGTSCNYMNFYCDYPGPCGVKDDCGFSDDCASAASATMDGATFTNAYLTGVDMSRASLRGVDFSNAMLVGVNFTGANLARDPNTGNATNFTEAFLESANFTDTQVTSVNFSNAFVDAGTDGGCMLFPLNAGHTQFKSFWGTPGNDICVTFSYDNGTELPDNTSEDNLCPDGNAGPCSSADRWNNTHIPMDRTTQKASTCEASSAAWQPICTDVDLKW